MPFDKLTLPMLKEHAKQHRDLIKGYSKMGKEELVKVLNKHLKIDKKGVSSKRKRCWKGYEPTPGKEPFSKGSCQKIEDTAESKGKGIKERKEALIGKIKTIFGGQLPSSFTKKLEKLEMKKKSTI